MTLELQARISKAILALHRQGVNANLVVLGRAEVFLLEGDDPNKDGLFRCKYLIDEQSQSRCDAYGQAGVNYIVPKEPTRITTGKKAIEAMAGEQFADLAFEEPEAYPTLDKKIILTSGFETNAYKRRYEGWIDNYCLQRNRSIQLERMRCGQFKLFDGDKIVFEGIITTRAQLKELVERITK